MTILFQTLPTLTCPGVYSLAFIVQDWERGHDWQGYEKHISLIFQNSIPVTFAKWKSLVNSFILLKTMKGTSLEVQWLELHASSEGDMGLTPGRGTKNPHVTQHSQKKKIKDIILHLSRMLWTQLLHWFAQATITKYPSLGGLKNTHLFPHNPGGWKSKVWAGLASPEASLTEIWFCDVATISEKFLQKATLCPHVAFLLCAPISVSQSPLIK